jgi:hypothetical protein
LAIVLSCPFSNDGFWLPLRYLQTFQTSYNWIKSHFMETNPL